MIAAQIDNLETQPQITLSAVDEKGTKELAKLSAWVLRRGIRGTKSKTLFVTIQLDVTVAPLENFGDKDKPVHQVFLTKLD